MDSQPNPQRVQTSVSTHPVNHHASNDNARDLTPSKKRRVLRACDMCRKRKIKCIGGETPGEICNNCRQHKWQCTFGDSSNDAHSTVSKSYVESLEARLAKTEKLLKQLCPDEALLAELQNQLDLNDESIFAKSPLDGTRGTTCASNSAPSSSTNDLTDIRSATHPLHGIGTLIRTRAAVTGQEAMMDSMASTLRRQLGRNGTDMAPTSQPQSSHEEIWPKTNSDGPRSTNDTSSSEFGVKQEELDDEEDATHVLAASLKELRLEPPQYRFFGKSSGAMLIKTALEMKSEFAANSASVPSTHASASQTNSAQAFMPPALAAQSSAGISSLGPEIGAGSTVTETNEVEKGPLPGSKMRYFRPEFWLPRPWETGANRPASSSSSQSQSPSYYSTSASPSSSSPGPRYAPVHRHGFALPPPDLGRALIDLYFAHVNLYLPLFHRPTFDTLVKDAGFLEPDPDVELDPYTNHTGASREGGFTFAQVYLLVCAVGASFSDDRRCLLDASEAGVDDEKGGLLEGMRYSAGWKWFDQVQMNNRALMTPPTLFDLQVYALCSQFLQFSSSPQSSWTMCGIGIRLAQDVGAHRRNPSGLNQGPTKESELWKRAFWVLVCMDRMFSCHLGRSCAIQDEDFDLDSPIDCDDEFWNSDSVDPKIRFKQPPRKPSHTTHFLLYIELTHILTFSLRTIYSINKSKVLHGMIGENWEQAVVTELDSALNKWADSVPDHLKWDPYREDESFFNQSASLWATYYHIQLLVHRPFIPSPSLRGKVSSKIPSLAICTSAARACCHIVDVQQRRTGPVMAHVQMAVFQSAVVLLLSIWGGKRSGLLIDASREMADVHKCMQIMKAAERKWHSLGRLWDILYELASMGDLPLPKDDTRRNKRDRDGELNEDTSSAPTHEVKPLPTDLYDATQNVGVGSAASSIEGSQHFGSFAQVNDVASVNNHTTTGYPDIPALDMQNIQMPAYIYGRNTSLSGETPDMGNVFTQHAQPNQWQTPLASSQTGDPPFLNVQGSHHPENPVSELRINPTGDFTEMDMWLNLSTGFNSDLWDNYLNNAHAMAQDALTGQAWYGYPQDDS